MRSPRYAAHLACLVEPGADASEMVRDLIQEADDALADRVRAGVGELLASVWADEWFGPGGE